MMSLLPLILARSVLLIVIPQVPVQVASPSPISPNFASVMLIFPVPEFQVVAVLSNVKSLPVNEISPPFEARLPKLNSPEALKIISPPFVDTELKVFAKLIVPFVTLNVTELPLPCCMSRLICSLEFLPNVILLLASRTTLVN